MTSDERKERKAEPPVRASAWEAARDGLVPAGKPRRRTDKPSRPEQIGHGAEGPAYAIPEIVAWLAAASASGITGNLAYDLLKSARRTAKSKSTTEEDAQRQADFGLVCETFVINAVLERCEKMGLAVPRTGDLRVRQWVSGPSSRSVVDLNAVVESLVDASFEAEVHMRVSPRAEKAKVRIRQAVEGRA